MAQFDVVIIGGGIMGLMCAYSLGSEKKIALIEKQTIETAENSSNDYSRVFRLVGDDKFYSELAIQSLELWKKIEEASGVQLYFPCGSLLLGDSENGYAMKGFKTAQAMGCKVMLYEASELSKKYPQFNAKLGVFDPNGGILDAQAAVKAIAALCRARGVTLREQTEVKQVNGNEIILEDGNKIIADKIVITSGAWVSKLLPDTVQPPRISRQHLFYLKPNAPELFSKSQCPVFGFIDDGFYGLPIHGREAVKVASHVSKNFVPFPGSAQSSPAELEACRQFLVKRIPLLSDSELVQEKICYYDMSPDGNFIIDRLDQTTTLGTGFCGMGFKFAPMVGKLLSQIVLGTAKSPERFQLR